MGARGDTITEVARASQLARGLKLAKYEIVKEEIDVARASQLARGLKQPKRERPSPSCWGRAGLTARAWIETIGMIVGPSGAGVARASQLARGLKRNRSVELPSSENVARASQLARGLKLQGAEDRSQDGLSRGPHSSRVD